MLLRKSVTVRVPVRLVDAAGAPVTGVLPADVQGGVATVVKASGATVDITLSGANFFEFSPASKTRGLYHITIPNTALDVVGPVQWVVLPAASLFSAAGYVGTGVVEDLASVIWSYLINSDGQSVVNTAAASLRLMAQFLKGVVQLDSGTNKYTIFKEDGTTVLSQRNTFNAAGDPSSEPVYKTAP